MCYFLCLAVPDSHENIADLFGPPIRAEPITTAPIAHAARGDQPARVYLLTANGCSCDLLHGGHRMESIAPRVLDALARLLERVPSIALMAHWYTQPIEQTPIAAAGEQRVNLARLRQLFPGLQEDVRYIVQVSA